LLLLLKRASESFVHLPAIRLIVATGVVIMLGSGIILSVITREEEKSLTEQAVEYASSSSAFIKKSIRFYMLGRNREAIQNMLENLTRNDNIKRITIYDNRGRVAYSSMPMAINTGHGRPPEAISGERKWSIQKKEGKYSNLVFLDPVYNEPSCDTAECHSHPRRLGVLGQVETDFAVSHIYGQLGTNVRRRALFPMAFFWLASLIAGFFFRRHARGLPGKEGQEHFWRSEHIAYTAFESICDPFIILDRDYRIVKANEAYAQMRGFPVNDLLNTKCYEVIYDKTMRCDECIVEKTFRSGDPCATDRLVHMKDGGEAWLEIYTYPIRDGQGNVSHVIEYSRDVTDRKRTEKTMKQEYLELEQIFDAAADATCVIDVDFRILRANDAFLTLVGRTREDTVGQRCHDVFPGPECGSPDCHLTKMLQDPESIIHFESGRNLGQGRDAHFIITATAFRGPDGEFIGIVEDFKDITGRKRTENELWSLSLQDELTGLCNRRGFLTLAAQELKMADRLQRGVYLLYADLDDLKHINDTLGHGEGDKVLQEIAAVLKVTFRASDIIARIGGDEFAVIPVGTDGDSVDTSTGRLQKNIDICNRKLKRSYSISLSTGVACYDPKYPCSLNELLIRADTLMYEEKRRRRG
jgi:diguanylate cyclase (GGDEF)-like protein/PAS domain S-box-containing protein